MPRDGLGQYAPPAGTHGIPNYTVESARYNTFVDDITIDLNTARSVASGGTGAVLPDAALDNLSAEKFKQVVVDWDANVWRAGSYYAASSATGISPIGDTMVITTPHAFAGIAYYANATDFVVEAVDLTDALHPRFMRVMVAGVWGAWVGLDLRYVLKTGDIMTGNLQISGANPVFSLNKQAGLGAQTAVVGGAMLGAPRWTMQLGNTNPESGGNIGSDFSIERYNDVGTTKLGTPIAIDRATGHVVLEADPIDPLGVVTKQYTDTKFTTIPPPVNPTDAASKAYVDARVLRAGDTMTGALSVPSLTSGPITCGSVNSTGTSHFIDRALIQGNGQPSFAVWNPASGQAWGWWVDNPGGGMYIGNTDASGTPLGLYLIINSAVLQSNSSQAYKPGGGAWAATVSDARAKNVVGDYTSSLDAVTALHPVRYTFKGNDSTIEGGTSPHAELAAAGTEFIGLIAQETEAAMPEMVSKVAGYLDGAAVSDLRQMDTGPLIYALIGALKEVKARLEALEG